MSVLKQSQLTRAGVEPSLRSLRLTELINIFVFIFAFLLQIKFLPDDTNLGKYLAKRNAAFSTVGNAETVEVVIAWGLREQDLSECHHTDPVCTGKTVWDDTFNVNAPEAQQALLVRMRLVGMCAKVYGYDDDDDDDDDDDEDDDYNGL